MYKWLFYGIGATLCSTLWRKKVLPALTMVKQNGYNQDWSQRDMLLFNRNIFDEKEVVCQWVDNGTACNNPVKVKDFKDHLYDSHGVTSNLQLYACQWCGCASDPMWRSSLERHMKEQHVPFRWLCPYCRQTFTRERTLLAHIEQSSRHE
ncbi:hypothetical protein HD554DRAFT_568345 [Boletus coccyginus]|nr:hypothetical protein HD554DRAFT_568345 [Boletus coccyginus]